MYCLLLSSSYEPLKFISDRRTFRLLFNKKVDVVSTWDLKIKTSSSEFFHPSIIKLNNVYIKRFSSSFFSRESIIKRDCKQCQYCGEKLTLNQITIDHVIPVSKGGKNTFDNCVVSCRWCNDYKSDFDLDKCGLKLLRKPANPLNSVIYSLPINNVDWHKDWDNYVV